MKDKRLMGIGVFFLISFMIVSLYLGGICVIKGDKYTGNAVLQRVQSLEVKNHRGKFYDRNMIPLVESGTEQLMIDDYGNINLKKGRALPGITGRYSSDGTAGHLIGYVDPEGNGVCGMEKAFDSVVSGSEYSKVNVLKSADGRIMADFGMSLEQGKDNANGVKLTLDSHIQKICEDAMSEKEITGAVVVMDVTSFDVLAMASMPDYDQRRVASYVSGKRGELVNRCLLSYNAGSIFKTVTLSTALEKGMVRSLYVCDGKIDLLDSTFNCHKKEGHGALSHKDAFAKSCNCAFYTMGLDMGPEAILATARNFGMGSLLLKGVDIGESEGNIPFKTEYSYGDCANYAIGQGEILITPLQAANAVCIIASEGISKPVNVADSICMPDGSLKRSLRRQGEKRVISTENARVVGDAMIEAVISGTGRNLSQNSAKIAGKTGTAETGWIENGVMLEHGWFCGYFPWDNPRFAMAVLVENGGSGAVSAAPLFGEIAEKIIKIYPTG